MNQFKNTILRNSYDVMVYKYQQRHRDLFTPEGAPHNGSGGGQAFWLGYRGMTFGAGFSASDKKTFNYASWRAGGDCRKAEGSAPAFFN